jgi:hypothetical protein
MIPASDVVTEALEQWMLCDSYWGNVYAEAMVDHRYFVGGELQWDRDIRSRLTDAKRPALTYNQIQQYVYNVVNEQKQNPSEAMVNPDSEGAEEKTARVMQDMLRKIRTSSYGNPPVVAMKDMVIGGIGWWKISHQYIHGTNKQRIVNLPCEWSSVYVDPSATYPTFHDADMAFRFYDLSRKTFRRKYNNAVATTSWDPFNSAMASWIGENNIRVAEHYFSKYRKRKIITLITGEDKYEDEISPWDRPLLNSPGGGLAKWRIDDFKEIWMRVISAVEVLESEEKCVIPQIPLIPCFGEREVIDGQLHIFGMVRAMRDPQIGSNFMKNSMVEAIARASKSQYLADPAHTEDFEGFYQNANVENRFYLPMHLIGANGEQLPPPVPVNQDIPVQEINIAIQAQDLSMQQAGGMYAASLGQQGNEESGEAILARQKPGERSSFRFTDGYNESIKYDAAQKIKMIPHIYDVPQVMHLEGLDGKTYQAAVLNGEQQGGDIHHIELQEGVQGIFDLSRGSYAPTVSTGPAYPTMRAEAQKSFAAIAGSLGQMPAQLAIILPFWIRSMDFPGHEELADALMPPGSKTPGDPKIALQQAAQQSQQQQMMIQHLSQIVQELTMDKKAEQTKLIQVAHIDHMKENEETKRTRMKLESAENLKKMDIHGRLAETAFKVSHEASTTQLEHEIGRIKQDKDHTHDLHMALLDSAREMAGKKFDSEHQEKKENNGE